MNPTPVPRHLVILTCCLLGFAGPVCDAGSSPFAVRGTLPWHNFLSGPTAWNEADYVRYLNRLKELGLNYVTFHCYTGGAERYAPYVEPLIRIEYRNTVPEAGLDTSLTARWGYRPLPVSDFAFGTDKLFPRPKGTDAFGATCAVTARTKEERYRQAQELMRRVIRHAHQRGIQVGLGFEFGIHPPELMSVVPHESLIRGALLPDPTHAASIEILHNTIDDMLRNYPDLDWVWLWLHEHTMHVGKPELSGGFQAMLARDGRYFEDADDAGRFTGVWSLAYIREAQSYLAKRAPRVRIALSGWGGGTQLPDTLRGLDKALPKDIVFTCLNPNQGLSPQPDVLAEIAQNREAWAIPWLEGDASLWHLQPRVGLMIDHVQRAERQRSTGVLAIHWRTEETRANLDAFALAAKDPSTAPTVEEFYRRDCAALYGPTAGPIVAGILTRMDRGQTLATQSPEYFSYNPDWGRLQPDLRRQVTEDAATLTKLAAAADDRRHRANLDWLLANFRFTLQLDDVSRGLEPAYRLKERCYRGDVEAAQLTAEKASALRHLREAPVEELFRTYARRVRSRGELGELSSLNQRLWLQYRELERFLGSLTN